MGFGFGAWGPCTQIVYTLALNYSPYIGYFGAKAYANLGTWALSGVGKPKVSLQASDTPKAPKTRSLSTRLKEATGGL